MNTVVSKAQAMRDAKSQASKFLGGGIPLKREATRLWKYLEPVHGGKPLPNIEVWISQIRLYQVRDGFQIAVDGVGANGRAYLYENRIGIKPFASQTTLAHELVHMALRGKTRYHDELFYRTLHRLQEKRWRMDIRMNEVRRWGYEVDGIFAKQIDVKLNQFVRPKFDWERSFFANPEKANPTNEPIMGQAWS